jgi:hypothetical protein
MAFFHIVTWRLKAGIMGQEEAAIARQRRRKHISGAPNQHSIIREMLEASELNARVLSLW